MTSILGRMFGRHADAARAAYVEAMGASDDLLRKMRTSSRSTDAARAVMADIWAQNRNIPFLTTVFESVQEMKSGTDQKPGGEQ